MAETQSGQYGSSLVPFLASSHSRDILGSRDDVRLNNSSHRVKASWALPAWISATAASKNTSGIQGPGGEGGGENWSGKKRQCLQRHKPPSPTSSPGSGTMQSPGPPDWTDRKEGKTKNCKKKKKREKQNPPLFQRGHQPFYPTAEKLEDTLTLGSELSSNRASRSK